ncbi:PREDICTED: G protein-regulated inducer of neurite outgrowth 1 [Elephantulus edwardii]|uniref:G protein-regulated inducer of neurite outgrowth 1 n=1 Tax=Elephantulus edwardii TaxID=28737 RepID=UPI0003F0D3A6|nr:PREDICTED: G protein-regulated inducer of neurite outgrowth 1 [Elephantulus edwardii]
MNSAEDPSCLRLLHKDPCHPGPQPTVLSCPQDGNLGAGGPAMRDYCPSQQKATPAPHRHTPDQGSGMDSSHSSPSVAGEGASCSEGPGGSLACPPSAYIPPQEVASKGTLKVQEASVSGTSETTFSGRPGISKAEPVSSVKIDPKSSETRNPMFLEKMDPNSSKVDSTSTAKDDAASSRKTDSVVIEQAEPAILGKGDPVSSGKVEPESLGKEDHISSSRVNTMSPRKEDTESLRKGEPVSSGKVESAAPRQEDPRCSEEEHPMSSEKVGPASSGNADRGSSGKNTSSVSVGKRDPGSLEKLPSGSLDKTELVLCGTGEPGPSGKEDPTSKGNDKTVSSTKEDPKFLEKMDHASSGKGDPISMRMLGAVSTGQADPVFSGKMDPTSLKNVEPMSSDKVGSVSLEKISPVSSGKPEPSSSGQAEPVYVGKTEPASSGKGTPVPSRSVDSISVGNVKAASSRKGDPDSLGKISPLSSGPGDSSSLGTAGLSSSVRADTVIGGKVGPLPLEKADSVASRKTESLTLGKGGPAKTRGDPEASPSGVDSVSLGKTVPMSLGKGDPLSPGKAAPAPERKVEPPPPEMGNPVNSTKVHPSTSGKTEPTETSEGKEMKPPEKEDFTSSGKAEAVVLQKEKQVASVDLGSSGKADPIASGKASSASPSLRKPESVALGKVATLTPTAEVSFRQSDDKPRVAAASPEVGNSGNRAEPELPHTGASGLGPKDLVATGAKSPGLGATVPSPGPRTRDNFTKAPSWEASALPPPREDAGTQAGAHACVSVAVSPMSPQDGAGGPAFSFQAAPRAPSPVPRPPSRRDAGLQVSLGAAETRSVATGPMTPQAAAPPVFPEVRVRPGSVLAAAVAPQEAAEPVRDVSWDEKGMTWEVYGASMEVEVLGMAIQKHLERQIEEHGRQGATSPPSSARPGPGRSGSVRAAPPEGTAKRPPGLFRALLQSVRRPRCCSRAGPTAE